MVAISSSEREFIAEGIALNVRGDGRTRMDYRDFKVKTDVAVHANGSARIQLAGTDILVAVNVELEEPTADKPNHGRVESTVDCTTSASLAYEGNGANDLNQELTRQVNRLIADSGAIDTKALCLIPGKQCWVVYVDAMVLAGEGSLLDAIMLGAKAALLTATIPKVTVIQGETDLELDVDGDPFSAIPLPFTDLPICVSLTLLGACFVVDANEEEELCMSSRLAVAVNAVGDVCGVHKTGAGGMAPGTMNELLKVARVVGLKLNAKLAGELAMDKDEEDEDMMDSATTPIAC